MSEVGKYSLGDPGVTEHIEMLQGIINRMAANSANCKTWAITLIVAVFALSDTDGWQRFFICLGATLLFFLLDCFYLGLERRFIGMQRSFVNHLYGEKQEENKSKCWLSGVFKKNKNKEKATKKEEVPIVVKPFKIDRSTWVDQLCGIIKGMVSLSTTPFYLSLVILPLIFVCVKTDNSQNNSGTHSEDSSHTIIISPQIYNLEHPSPNCLIESFESSSKANPQTQSSKQSDPHSNDH